MGDGHPRRLESHCLLGALCLDRSVPTFSFVSLFFGTIALIAFTGTMFLIACLIQI